jgi:hypothetical protein
MEVEPRSAMPQRRRLAFALAVTLVGFAALAYALAALFDFTLSAGQSLDPYRGGFATVFASSRCGGSGRSLAAVRDGAMRASPSRSPSSLYSCF